VPYKFDCFFFQIKDLTNKQYKSKVDEMKNICSREVKIKEAKIQEIAKELEVSKKENSSSAIEMYKASNEKQAQVTI